MKQFAVRHSKTHPLHANTKGQINVIKRFPFLDDAGFITFEIEPKNEKRGAEIEFELLYDPK